MVNALHWILLLATLAHLASTKWQDDTSSTSNTQEPNSFQTWSRFPDPSKIYKDVTGKDRIDVPNNLYSPDIPVIRKDGIYVGVGSRERFSFLKNDFELLHLADDTVEILKKIQAEGLCGSRTGLQGESLWEMIPHVLGLTEQEEDCAVNDLVWHFRSPFSRFPSLKDTFTFVLETQGFIMHKGGPDNSILIPGTGKVFDGTTSFFHIDLQPWGRPLNKLLGDVGLHWIVGLPFFQIMNVWIPLRKVNVRPLAVVDNAHQRRHAEADISTAYAPSINKRDGEKSNVTFYADLWFLRWEEDADASPTQPRMWLFDEMDTNEALVFSTTRSAHNAVSLPGEDVLAKYYELLLYVQHDSLRGTELEVRCSSLSSAADVDAKSGYSNSVSNLIEKARLLNKDICEGISVQESEVDDLVFKLTRESLSLRVVCLVFPYTWVSALVAAYAGVKCFSSLQFSQPA